jgi:hypothetical protein
MQRQSESLVKSLFLALMAAMLIIKVCAMPVGAATAAPSATAQKAASPAAATSKDDCLNCHGPFDKLSATSAGYVAPSGEKISPHRFVPHNSKEVKAIPGCSNCHEPHPLPPKTPALAGLPKPDVQWCYTACHHKNNFVLCKDCHK